MIQDLISNIIQNSQGSSPDGAQNLPANTQLNDEFSSLLNALKNEQVSTVATNYKQNVLIQESQSQKENDNNEAFGSEEFDLENEQSEKEKSKEQGITQISVADIQLKEISVEEKQVIDQNRELKQELKPVNGKDEAISNEGLLITNQKGANSGAGDSTSIDIKAEAFTNTKESVDRGIFRQENKGIPHKAIQINESELAVSDTPKSEKPDSSITQLISSKVITEVKAEVSDDKSIVTVSSNEGVVTSEKLQLSKTNSIQDENSTPLESTNDVQNNIGLNDSEESSEQIIQSRRASEHQPLNNTLGKDISKQVLLDSQLPTNQLKNEEPPKTELVENHKNKNTFERSPQVVTGQIVQPILSSESIARNTFQSETTRTFLKPTVVQQITDTNKQQTQNAPIPVEFSEAKNPELIQFIQSNKTDVIKPKEAKNPRFALSMTEQAETRLKLLVDSVRPEILSSREVPVGFISSHSLDENIQFFNPSLTLSHDQEALLKEFMMESTSIKAQNSSDQNLMGYLRLGELPLVNTQARLSLVSNFAKVMQQEMSTAATRQNEGWQKHSFKLDDGNNIDMTTKNVDGILHIKLAASNPELNRLLMSMEQEIKDHLKEELNLELELQFSNNQEQSFSDALGDNSGERRNKLNQIKSELSEDDSTQEAVNSLQPSIRNFGYNQMEWTA